MAAMRRVPRQAFVPPALEASAHDDRPLPIGHGQTISQPFIVALMTDMLRTAPAQTVLEIGTGSGYQAAILADLVATAQHRDRDATGPRGRAPAPPAAHPQRHRPSRGR
nr:hypothetical protein [Neoroseomonas marina]